ncbi:MAG: ABC transporter ATP-binding protein [Ruminococcaceae bacterium]|nr:ABC transporter ATP-binding protein [Oscillospiraceae bacterium]
MKKLLRYMRPYTKECILGPLLKLAEATLELLVPLVMAAIIDNGIHTNDRGYVVWMCLLLAGLGLVGLGFSVTAQYFAAKAATGFTARLRQVLFGRIQRLSYATLDEVSTPTLVTRMTSDMNQVQNGVNLALRLLLRSPFVVFGAMIMAFTLDVPGALVFAVVIPLLSVAVFGIMLPCIPLYKKVQTRLDKVLGRTRENLDGVRVIRAFRKEPDELEAFRADNDALTDAQNFVGRISALLNPLTYVLINAAILVLLWTGAIRVEHGILTQGVVVALYNYMSQILVELIKLANLIITITKAVACGNRIQAVLELPVDQDGQATLPAKAPAVAWQDVTLRYHPDSEPALSHVTLTVQPGETLGIIGGTSAGKTSLVNLVPRFYDATEGAVLVGGVDVQQLQAADLRRHIGVVPQQAVLFHGTVRENLLYGDTDATDEVLWEALEAAQAKGVVEDKPGGLDFVIEQGGRNLSGGQRQRLTIARALTRRPDILILDDSAAALDYATEAALRASLRSLSFRPTVLLISQRVASVQEADRIAVLEDGRLVGLGTHAQLLEDCPVYREIYASQMQKEVTDRG